MYYLIIFGPPGVGKGTQAELIAKSLSLEHISTGEILRNAVNEGTELGRKAKKIIDSGSLVPDGIMNGIMKETLTSITSGNGFILDGYPRTVNQAESLDKIFKELNILDIKIIYLSADEEEIVNRLLKRGRSDDSEDTIRERLKIYQRSTEPVKEFYEKKYNVIQMNGVGKIEEINRKILSAIKERS